MTLSLPEDVGGHDECMGEKVGNHRGVKMKFYGMSSEDAQITYYGEKESHRLPSEGKTVYVDYRGPVKNTIEEIMGGLRSPVLMQAKNYQGLTKVYNFCKSQQTIKRGVQLMWFGIMFLISVANLYGMGFTTHSSEEECYNHFLKSYGIEDKLNDDPPTNMFHSRYQVRSY